MMEVFEKCPAVSGDWKFTQPDTENHHHHDTQPEGGETQAHGGNQSNEVIRYAPLIQRCDDGQGKGQYQRKNQPVDQQKKGC